MTTALSKLSTLETTIAAGMETFLDVGNALRIIRDERLYRDGYQTWEEYTKERWGWGKSYANNLIKASETSDNLTTIVAKPKTESQFREVAKAPAEKQAAVVEAAAAKAVAEDREPTAKDYKEAREEVCGTPAVEPEYEDIDEPEVAKWDMAVINTFRKCECRLGTLRQLVSVLSDTEIQILKDWLA